MGEFTTVYLFTNIGKIQNLIIFGGITLYFVVFGYLWVKVFKYLRNRPKNKPISDSAIRQIFQIVAAMAIVPIAASMPFRTFYYISFHDEYSKLLAKYEAQQYQIAEGVVHVLHTQNPLGHDQGDIIMIDNVEFEINAYVGGWNYDKTISHGGALTEGTYARVYYMALSILSFSSSFPTP